LIFDFDNIIIRQGNNVEGKITRNIECLLLMHIVYTQVD